MKFFLTICTLAVIGALVVPFFLNVGGKPIMSVDAVIDDATPAALQSPTQVFKWQDKHGLWQFGETPPEGQAVEPVEVQDKITRMDDDWHGEALTPASKPAVKLPTPGFAAYADGGRALMEQATTEVDRLNERTKKLEQMRQDLN
ncbi:MAG: hypothetical protein ACR2PZ_17920 [Pseudomonadales bacterium]